MTTATATQIAKGQRWRLKPSPCGYSCEFVYDANHLDGRNNVMVLDGTLAVVRSVAGEVFLDFWQYGWLHTIRIEVGRLVKNWDLVS